MSEEKKIEVAAEPEKTQETVTDGTREVTVVESLCVKCHENGTTRIMVEDIPFFKTTLVSSFECPHCHYKNTQIDTGLEMADQAVKYTLKVNSFKEMDRMVVISSGAMVFFPQLDFEIPSVKQSTVSTVQGIIATFHDDLSGELERLEELKAEGTEGFKAFVDKLKLYVDGDDSVFPFHIIIEDLTGNSFVNNPVAPLPDSNLHVEKFFRTKEQMIQLGYKAEEEVQEKKAPEHKKEVSEENKEATEENKETSEEKKEVSEEKKETTEENKTEQNEVEAEKQGEDAPKKPVISKYQKSVKMTDQEVSNMMKNMVGNSKPLDAHRLDTSKKVVEGRDIEDTMMSFQLPCYACQKMGEMRSCQIEIPFFKELLIMSFSCEFCGYRNSEVKSVGAVSEKAKRITLTLTCIEDLSRDVFKSETVKVNFPEIDLEVQPGTLGSVYTTVEGLIDSIIQNFQESNPFKGDSAVPEEKAIFDGFIQKLTNLKEGKILPFTLVLDDPMDNCFVLNPNYPHPDPNIQIESYDRTKEQNEELGIDYLEKM